MVENDRNSYKKGTLGYRECITEKVTEGKCATDQALDTTDMVEVPNETLYSCLTFGRRKKL